MVQTLPRLQLQNWCQLGQTRRLRLPQSWKRILTPTLPRRSALTTFSVNPHPYDLPVRDVMFLFGIFWLVHQNNDVSTLNIEHLHIYRAKCRRNRKYYRSPKGLRYVRNNGICSKHREPSNLAPIELVKRSSVRACR